MKKIILILSVLLLTGCTQEVIPQEEVSDGLEVQLFNINGSMTGNAFLKVDSNNNDTYLNVLADINKDGVFAAYEYLNTTQEEWIIKNMRPLNGVINRFAFQLNDTRINSTTMINLKLIQNNNKITNMDDVKGELKVVSVTNTNSAPLLALDVPGSSEDLKRATGNDFHIDREVDTPDLSGGPMDCFAISAANNIISLAREHDREDDLPSPTQMITELKDYMNWDNGIKKSDFMPGKKEFVEKYKLPIKTEEINRPTMDDFEWALAHGAAMEVSTTMIRSRSDRSNTGHVLTGMGAMNDGDFAGIAVHDPATGEGVDVYDVTESGGDKPYLIINYPLWDGVTFIDTLYVQTWIVNETSNETVSMLTPGIEGIEYVQLHDNPQAFPHKYQLIATVNNASNPAYSWETNCGYFIGSTDSSSVEWWYDTWDCADSMIILTVTNENGLSDSIEYTPFI